MIVSDQVNDAPPAVLITGGAKRLGAVIARRFSAAGFHVIVHCNRSPDAARDLVQSLPSGEVVQADLADLENIDGFVAAIAKRISNWVVLINSAAVFDLDGPDSLSPDVFSRTARVNAASPAMMAQAFLRHADAIGRRRVVNLIDQKIANTNPDFFSYTMSKEALFAATRMMAMAIEGTGDRVYGLCPGAMLPSHDQRNEEHERSGRLNLLRRLTQPTELADAALFLAQGSAANGQLLFVDSGQHLLRQRRDVLYLAREEREED